MKPTYNPVKLGKSIYFSFYFSHFVGLTLFLKNVKLKSINCLFQMSMQFGLADMTGGHPGVHGLGADASKLGQHFSDRYGLQ